MKRTDSSINKTKLSAPIMSPQIITRKKLSEKLRQIGEHRLTLIIASAGSGKTTAVRSCLPDLACKYVWYSIDEYDNDPIRFWRNIIVSLDDILAGSGIAGLSVNTEGLASNILADELINLLYDYAQPLVYVLDDYYLIQNPLIKKSVAYFIKYIPANVSIVIISRKEEEELDRLYVQCNALRIGNRDLAFTREDIAAFFSRRNVRLTQNELPIVENYTEGWAAGLVVIAMSLKEGLRLHSVCGPQATLNHHIDKFLKNEVFEKWPDSINSFLIKTSFLERLSGPLCRKVTGNEDSAEILCKLSESNSFIIALDQGRVWFRYHHLFREFLQSRLAVLGDSIIEELQRNAAQWYDENGQTEDAVHFYILSKSFDKAVSLIISVMNRMAQFGEYYTLCQWFDHIPEEYLLKHVTACTGYSWILSMVNRVDDALKWGRKSEEAFERCSPYLNETQRSFLKADIALANANAAIRVMQVEKACSLLREACKYKLSRTIMSGELNPGESSLLKTDYCCRGMIRKSAEAYTGIIKVGQNLLGDFSCYFNILWAEILYERNDLGGAYEVITKEMGRVIALGLPGLIVPCFLTLAKIRQADGDSDGAFLVLKEGARKLTGEKAVFWNRFFEAYEVRLHLARKDGAAAGKWQNKRHLGLFDPLSSFQESEYLSLARILISCKRFQDALLLLGRLDFFAQDEKRFHSRIEILCLLSLAYIGSKNTELAMKALDEALKLGTGEVYVRTFLDEWEPMSKLLAQYLRWKKKSGTDERSRYARRLFRLINENLSKIKNKDTGKKKGQILTAKEEEVLLLILRGQSNDEIARNLYISVNTVKYHVSNIYGKLGAKNRLEAVKRAMELKIIKE